MEVNKNSNVQFKILLCPKKIMSILGVILSFTVIGLSHNPSLYSFLFEEYRISFNIWKGYHLSGDKTATTVLARVLC